MFLAAAPDVLGLLTAQGMVSVAALDAFSRWSQTGEHQLAEEVRSLEHEADHARRDLLGALREALATPIDQEDLFVLSEGCDRVVNAVKNLVRQAEVVAWSPDGSAGEMGGELFHGVQQIVKGFGLLSDDPDGVCQAADAAVKSVRAVEHTYRSAMAALLDETDLKVIFTTREMYGAYLRAADELVGVADRLWYAVLAGG
jgi:uncharacterized protein Yka (UPF0111/DUF47 family)